MVKFSIGFSLFLILLLLFAGQHCFAQVKVMPVSKADSAMTRQAKPLLILLSTDWCKFCHMQKSQLRKNKEFIKKADSFYYVEFNAESKENIRFNGQDYHFRPSGASTGIHEFAEALNGSERVAYPTWVLLDKNYQVLFRYNGVLAPKQLNELLTAIDEMNKK